VNVEIRNTKLCVGSVHSFTVLVEAVHNNALIYGLVGLGSFKAFNTIVKGSIFRHELEGHIRYNLGFLPPTIVEVIINLKHIVCGDATEGVLVLRSWLFLEIFGPYDGQVAGHKTLLLS
jgi:hypothetical protein